MKLIKRIEINYLRSLYTATLNSAGDLNVVFGRNDSGKSNLLRALNLFFNDEIEPSIELDFDLDISDERKRAARQAKVRQFIWIKITFQVPDNYRSTLGEEISIKRQWNRDGDMNETVFPALNTPGQQSRMTRFLNDIDFTYIPAIKDLKVYSDLIERVYKAAAVTPEIGLATTNFVESIGARTLDLSAQLTQIFGSPSQLAAPTDMAQLFRTLDFSLGEDQHSLLRQKGDGVKARHLPEILHYVNQTESRPKLYIWGFEEPENSLDLHSAELEARRFGDFAARTDTQVFITSHSPAFYLADHPEGAELRRYFITKQSFINDEVVPSNAALRMDTIEEAERAMDAAGLLQLPFLIRRISQFRSEISSQAEEARILRENLNELEAATLFVEGAHDEALFRAALDRRHPANGILIRSLGGAPENVDNFFAAVMSAGGLQANQRTFFLLDNDHPGRNAFRRLTGSSGNIQTTEFGDGKFAACLPQTREFSNFLRRNGLQASQAFFTAEFLFPVQQGADICLELIQAREQQGQGFQAWKGKINGQYWKGIGQETYQGLLNSPQGSADWLYARGVPDTLKAAFAAEIETRGVVSEELDTIVDEIVASLT